MIINMLVAIWTTNIPLLLNGGFWSMAYEARTDHAKLLASISLLLVETGSWSLDAKIANRNSLNFLGGTDGFAIDDLPKMRRNCNTPAN